jgi:hypothetical protein
MLRTYRVRAKASAKTRVVFKLIFIDADEELQELKTQLGAPWSLTRALLNAPKN